MDQKYWRKVTHIMKSNLYISKAEKRIEEKLIYPISKKHLIVNMLFENSFEYLYPSRKIQSTYYENNKFNIFTDSQNGILPRKKIRVRDSFGKLYLEKKISNENGKFKSKKEILRIPQKIIDKDYGVLSPILNVEYDRSYFADENARVTLDNNILISKPNESQKFKYQSFFIVEFKLLKNYKISKNFIDSNFIDKPMKFSKFDFGIEKIYSPSI